MQQVDPAEFSPGRIRPPVREPSRSTTARVVVIDSLNGYMNAMPEERFLTIQLHEVAHLPGPQGRHHASWSSPSTA